MSVFLAEMTFEDAVAHAGAVALLPTGATEAHGPHLPLNTDVVISREGAMRAALALRQEGIDAVVLPPLAYAVTEFAATFGGTISLPFETAKAMIRDVILGAVRAGFPAVVLCNAHLEPDNIRALKTAMDEANAQGAKVAFPDVTRKPHALRLGEEFRSGACHAGRYESSLVLASRPDLVRDKRADLAPNPSSLSVAIREGKKNFVEAGGPDAYFGWPADASVAEGEQLYATMADIFSNAAKELVAR